ncbi:MAG: YicC family protein [Gammaproteobacteria bacterium]|nr:MAG: YicC family protein [Gammaproteobacteria bacterium]RKZ44356.1 MAG: YicC family protein [Gammaproteobacteria bacterium]
MNRSMTAFARLDTQETWGHICWELRSVNHRYLDISIRLPEEFRPLEMNFRERIQKRLKRGKIDGILYFQTNKNNGQWQINPNLVQQLWEKVQQINAITGNTIQPNPLDILRWQGVLETNIVDVEEVGKTVLEHFDSVLAQLITHREREGTQLATLIEQRCTAIVNIVVQIRNELPLILQSQRERLQARLTELVELNSERLEQEIVILAQKMDVAEELERLETHLTEIRQTLMKDQAIGRRLDFLTQELHREANTLGAKSNHINTTRYAVDLKVLIEQIREQTQNIE